MVSMQVHKRVCRADLPSSSSKSESSSSLGWAVGWFCGVSMGGAGAVAGEDSLSAGTEGVAMMDLTRAEKR